MVQGRGVDASLNETGRKQALKVYEHLQHVSFDVIFTSTLRRTHETVKYFQQQGIPHSIHSGFDEISWGNQEGKKADLESKNMFAQTVQAWKEGNLDINVGGGESPNEVMYRQKRAMEEVLSHGAEKILICMHGRALRILLCWLLNYPLTYMDEFPHDNCAYYKLIYRGSDFFVDEFNYKEHLV